MKPKNRHQRMLVELDRRLPWWSKDLDKQRYMRSLFAQQGIVYKSGKIICLECGHSFKHNMKRIWHAKVLKHECPRCRKELKLLQSRRHWFIDTKTVLFIEKHLKWQMVIAIEVTKTRHKGEKVQYSYRQLGTAYAYPGRKYIEYIGSYATHSWSGTRFSWGYDLRHPKATLQQFGAYDKVCPNQYITTYYRKRGIYRFPELIHSVRVLHEIENPKFEILMKHRRYGLMAAWTNDRRDMERFWPSIRVALRHKYKISDPVTWLDYLRLLHMNNRDLHNPVYVCPKDLHQAHQHYLDLDRKRRSKEEMEARWKEIKKDEPKYAKKIKPFKNCRIISGKLVIEPIQSVFQLAEESGRFRHCAWKLNYHKKENRLLLSARYDNIPVETVEIDMESWEIMQSRGLQNRPSKHNKKIIRAVSEGMEVFVNAWNKYQRELKKRKKLKKQSA